MRYKGQTGGGGGGGGATMEMVTEAHIDWTAEAAGTVGATHVDSVTGATWTKTTDGTQGSLAASIGGSGIVLSGTAGAANATIGLTAPVEDLVNGATTGAPYDPALDAVEILHVCPVISIATIAMEVATDLRYSSGTILRIASVNFLGTQQRRVLMVDDVGLLVEDIAETFSEAVFATRLVGTMGAFRYATSLVSTDWAMLSSVASKERWSMRAGNLSGSFEGAILEPTAAFVVVGQTGGSINLTISDTYVRRWRAAS